MSLLYLQRNAETKMELDIMNSEITGEEKEKIEKLGINLRGLVIRKMIEFSGKTEKELEDMAVKSPEKFQKLVNETSEKLVQDGEFTSFWETIPNQFSAWHKGAGKAMWPGSVWIFGILGAAGTAGNLLATGFNSIPGVGEGLKDATHQGLEREKKILGISAVAAILSAPPVLRFATFYAGKVLELDNELAYLAIHPLDEWENISRKRNFDAGTEKMLGTWENRKDYISDKYEIASGEGADAKKFKFQDILKRRLISSRERKRNKKTEKN